MNPPSCVRLRKECKTVEAWSEDVAEFEVQTDRIVGQRDFCIPREVLDDWAISGDLDVIEED